MVDLSDDRVYAHSNRLSAGHCKKLAPTWSQLAEEYKDNKNVSIDQVDCTKARSLCEKAEVRGYPTLKSYHNGEQHAVFKGMNYSLECSRKYYFSAPGCFASEVLSSILPYRIFGLLAGGRSIDALREYLTKAVNELTAETTA
jgi:thiol-disulfide isomerase/thioredoxin